MRLTGWLVLSVLFLLPGYVGCSRSQPEPTPAPSRSAAEQPAQPPVPPYYESADAARPFPKTLSPRFFRNPYVARAYQIAREIPDVLAQLPCYCWCDKIGHRSLLDCYASDHGANCLICIKENLLADELARKSRSAAEIRKAIIRGDWRRVIFSGRG